MDCQLIKINLKMKPTHAFGVGSNWNISLFHYRNHGSDFGRVLIGIQVEPKDLSRLLRHLKTLNYEFFEETSNKAYHLFLS